MTIGLYTGKAVAGKWVDLVVRVGRLPTVAAAATAAATAM